MLVLSSLSCSLLAIQVHQVCLYPIGVWCANQGLSVPDQAVHLILPVGPAGLPGLAKGSCQIFGGILPLVVRTLICAYTHALILGTSRYPLFMLSRQKYLKCSNLFSLSPQQILGSCHSPPQLENQCGSRKIKTSVRKKIQVEPDLQKHLCSKVKRASCP